MAHTRPAVRDDCHVAPQRVRQHLTAALPTMASLAVIVPIGFYSKFYRGPGAHWVNDSLAGAFYVVFWCLVVFLLRPRGQPRTIAGGVLAATCVLEFLQLWHPPFLEFLRSYFLGSAILGTTFDWTDFPYYFMGSGLGWFWLTLLRSGRVRAASAGRVRAAYNPRKRPDKPD